jgi:dipeptidyl aminopeptidase/acylaminoacyl peptidase
MLRLTVRLLALFTGLVLVPRLPAQDNPAYRTPSAALATIVDAPLPPTASLSPDRRSLLLLDRPDAPSIAQLAQPELRLAGLRINPATHGSSRLTFFIGLAFKPLDGGPERRVTGLPAPTIIGDYEWSRDSRHLALTLVRAEGTELWVVTVATAQARQLTGPILNTVFGEPIVWVDGSTLAIRRVPSDHGSPPVAPLAPSGPVVQATAGRRSANRTFQDLLASPLDEQLFEHYATSELALVQLDGKLSPLPLRGLLTLISPAPDGSRLLVSALHRPYSYLVPWSRFPTTIDVIDRAGARQYRVTDRALFEGTIGEAVPPGPRAVAWRPDQPATLTWTQALARGALTPDKKTARDAWFTLAAPFTGQPVEQQRFEFRLSSVQWCDDRLALVTESWTNTRLVRTWQVAPGKPGSARQLLHQRSSEDRYADRGRPALTRNAFGRPVLLRSADAGRIYLAGPGASPEGDRPFLDEYDLTTGATRRLWRSAPPHYEEFMAFTDDTGTRALMVRESPAEPAHYVVRTLASGALTPITTLANPFPQFAGVKAEVIHYKRADGVALSGQLYLPPGWSPGQGPLPTLLWAYPREFQSEETAGQVKATPDRFVRVSATGPLPFLLAGYAVLDDPAMPIVARPGRKSNDTYIEQLVANAQAAIDELARRGVSDPQRMAVGGHSYGAFMTANLLAHSRLFRAGIARSGAYNRTLTPFGFQREQRTLWQAPEVYAAMSPFNFADKVKDPLLLIHGTADNNAGTFPLQSERFYQALKGHGATARLVLLPHESHGYRARESLLHMLWEIESWLDTHVKPAAVGKKSGKE